MILPVIIFFIVVLIFGMTVFRGSPYVPSQKKYVQQAFSELYPLCDKDLLVDIGSGDGVVLRIAAKFGAKAVGFEINPIMVLISKFLSRKYQNIHIKLADFWSAKLPDKTTIVYIFSVSRDMQKLMIKLQSETNRLGRPINIISFGSEFERIKITKNVGPCHLYILYPKS